MSRSMHVLALRRHRACSSAELRPTIQCTSRATAQLSGYCAHGHRTFVDVCEAHATDLPDMPITCRVCAETGRAEQPLIVDRVTDLGEQVAA
ncbi:hypothetical protein AB0M43_23675 [Longispora sp. NPDC051575]|uniref:hypothetical protein n=1 Tax=Longispora sp. NPDC051575 TaxID=3154943 RepID=UPI00343E92F6